jgi:hypothetical protein
MKYNKIANKIVLSALLIVSRSFRVVTEVSDIFQNVAPHAGAWIEIRFCAKLLLAVFVAPHAGAWIEIMPAVDILPKCAVAPHAGAWIEILF